MDLMTVSAPMPHGFAYLDPGSGSIIIQLVIAAVLGLGLVIRTQWARIKKLFGRETWEDEEHDSKD